MYTKTITRVLAIGLCAGLAFTGLTACDAPQESEPPAVQETESPMETTGADERAEAPGDEMAAQDPAAEPGAQPDGMAQQQEPPQMGQPDQAGHMAEVDSETLDEFAVAFMEVQQIQGEVQQQLQAVESPEEAREVQQQVVAQIQERVEATGMDFQEYMMLAQRLERDPALQQRLEQRLQ